jgi:hypothetical protein
MAREDRQDKAMTRKPQEVNRHSACLTILLNNLYVRMPCLRIEHGEEDVQRQEVPNEKPKAMLEIDRH